MLGPTTPEKCWHYSRSLWDAMQKEKNNRNPQFTVNRSDELLYVSVIRVLILLNITKLNNELISCISMCQHSLFA
jgi:hypothetical protein